MQESNRIITMPPIKGRFRSCTEEAILAVIEDVKLHRLLSGKGRKTFGVPKNHAEISSGKDIHGKENGTTVHTKRPIAEESHICVWILSVVAAGFPVTTNELTISAQQVIRETKINSFKDYRPGRTWIKGFLKRNQKITSNIENQQEDDLQEHRAT